MNVKENQKASDLAYGVAICIKIEFLVGSFLFGCAWAGACVLPVEAGRAWLPTFAGR